VVAISFYLLQPAAATSIQDPLSFRVAPQVHGALRELLGFARRAVETELNSQSDNPLVSVEDQAMVHNGNFHPIMLALAFDGLRGAIAHVGQLSERRMSTCGMASSATSPASAPNHLARRSRGLPGCRCVIRPRPWPPS